MVMVENPEGKEPLGHHPRLRLEYVINKEVKYLNEDQNC